MPHRTELRPILDDLRQLRDEVRVRLHLAGMDAKDEWARLQPELEKLEKTAEHVVAGAYDETRALAIETREALRALRDRVKQRAS